MLRNFVHPRPCGRTAAVAVASAALMLLPVSCTQGPDSVSNPAEVRALVGDGNYHGRYQRPDDEMTALWQVAVEETRALIEHGWP